MLNHKTSEMYRNVGVVYEIIAQQNKLVYYREIWNCICIQRSLTYHKSNDRVTGLEDPDIESVAQMSNVVYTAFVNARKRFYLKYLCRPKDYVAFAYTPRECRDMLEKNNARWIALSNSCKKLIY